MRREPLRSPFTRHASANRLGLVVLPGASAEIDDETYREQLSDVLRVLRRRLGKKRGQKITQEQAAEWMGIDAGTLGRWERGDNAPKPQLIPRIAEAYGLPRESWWIFLQPARFATSIPADLWQGKPLTESEIAQLDSALEEADEELGAPGGGPAQPNAGAGARGRQAS